MRLIDADAYQFPGDLVNEPTIDAVPVVHGRWEIKWNAEFVDPFGETEEIPSAVCPFCGHEEFYVAYDDGWAKPHNYCPNCGAKMDGGNDAGNH